MTDRSDRTKIPSLSLDTIPALDCTNFSSTQLRCTPFADSAISERFEYPFPTTQPLASPEAYSPTSSSSTHSLADGSIVPPSCIGRGRGMSLSSFVSSPQGSPPTHSETLPSPSSAAVAASQSLNDTPPRDALRTNASAVHHHRRTVSQTYTLAGINPPMPPSLVQKRRSLRLSTTASDALGTEGGLKH